MNLSIATIITDQRGELLLCQEPHSEAWDVPTTPLGSAATLAIASAEYVRQRTGLAILPVRLATLLYLPWSQTLIFYLRGLVRGGEIDQSAEKGKIGYLAPRVLNLKMEGWRKTAILQATRHASLEATWETAQLSWRESLRLHRQPQTQQQGHEVAVELVIGDEQKRVLHCGDFLPTYPTQAAAPWDVAVRRCADETGLEVELARLAQVRVQNGRVVLRFCGRPMGGMVRTGWQWHSDDEPSLDEGTAF